MILLGKYHSQKTPSLAGSNSFPWLEVGPTRSSAVSVKCRQLCIVKFRHQFKMKSKACCKRLIYCLSSVQQSMYFRGQMPAWPTIKYNKKDGHKPLMESENKLSLNMYQNPNLYPLFCDSICMVSQGPKITLFASISHFSIFSPFTHYFPIAQSHNWFNKTSYNLSIKYENTKDDFVGIQATHIRTFTKRVPVLRQLQEGVQQKAWPLPVK